MVVEGGGGTRQLNLHANTFRGDMVLCTAAIEGDKIVKAVSSSRSKLAIMTCPHLLLEVRGFRP